MVKGLEISDEKIDRLAGELDAGSRKVIYYLLENRRAKIDELMQIMGESSHMNALTRIKDVINPKALKILKRPFLVFEKSRIDKETGEKFLFNWWLAKEDEEKLTLKKRQFPIDIFDEEKEVVVVMDLQGINEEDIDIKVKNKKVNIAFKDSEHVEYLEEVVLPGKLSTNKFDRQFNNQILTIRIAR